MDGRNGKDGRNGRDGRSTSGSVDEDVKCEREPLPRSVIKMETEPEMKRYGVPVWRLRTSKQRLTGSLSTRSVGSRKGLRAGIRRQMSHAK